MLYNPVSWINDATERNKEQQSVSSGWTLSVILLWVFGGDETLPETNPVCPPAPTTGDQDTTPVSESASGSWSHHSC